MNKPTSYVQSDFSPRTARPKNVPIYCHAKTPAHTPETHAPAPNKRMIPATKKTMLPPERGRKGSAREPSPEGDQSGVRGYGQSAKHRRKSASKAAAASSSMDRTTASRRMNSPSGCSTDGGDTAAVPGAATAMRKSGEFGKRHDANDIPESKNESVHGSEYGFEYRPCHEGENEDPRKSGAQYTGYEGIYTAP
ncbi:hypothetical protein DFH27DRAFT_528006 [Peziza echinospora]|nr:hypothetical protein DFH27DRAFT_528006 [Peziza echinospora]